MASIIFRTDASGSIGSGHLIRCSRIAKSLQECGYTIMLVAVDHAISQTELIRNLNIPLAFLRPGKIDFDPNNYDSWISNSIEEDATQTIDLLKTHTERPLAVLVDHYSIDYRWEERVKSYCNKIIAIDDLANRRHDCDLLIDYNFYLESGQRYKSLVPSRTVQLIGPDYAPLDHKFMELRGLQRGERSRILNILLFFGGSNIASSFCEKVAEALAMTSSLGSNSLSLTFLVNNQESFSRISAMSFKVESVNFVNYCHDMPSLINACDIVIGGGGISTLERACLGKPAIVYTIADNQKDICRDAEKKGFIKYLGDIDDFDSRILLHTLSTLIANHVDRERMAEIGRSVVDGKGLMRMTTAIAKLLSQ